MRLGDLLVAANLVTVADIERASEHQVKAKGQLGDNLVAIGAITREALEAFTRQIPREPKDIYDTGLNSADLLNLLIKLIYSTRLESASQYIDAIKLPPLVVEPLVQMAVDRNLLAARGSRGNELRYELSALGQQWAQDAMKASLYAGPAPVTLAEFCDRILAQKITNDPVTFAQIKSALRDYDVTDKFIEKIGPALNSGRAMLLYGPPGNGKTTVALSFADVFSSVIYIPYAVMIEGQIMRVFDPSLHEPLEREQAPQQNAFSSLQRDPYDSRWVAIRRPFVVTGGELTMEMLDLSYDPTTGFYEAPLHIKALGGCFVIDDFGRQMVNPTSLLNRWIVPMESKVDFLKLHTGKSFALPFEALLIFSTNLNPEDLMDPAFLRRLPYKIEIGSPSRETFKAIFTKLSADRGIEFNDDVFNVIVHKITKEKRLEIAAFQARFIVDQVVAVARFKGVAPRFDLASIDYALDNLKVHQG